MQIRDILERFAKKEISVSEAERLLKLNAVEEVENFAKIDVSRHLRKGVPEIILADGKLPEHTAKIAIKALARNGSVIISRVSDQDDKLIRKNLPRGVSIEKNDLARTIILRKGAKKKESNGIVGIITAGTSDMAVAEEAKVVLEEMGCKAVCTYDVGVAGIHRLFPSIKMMIEEDVAVIVAVAGREGAMPTIIAGLVDIPVIGVPTSVGYGFGDRGMAALQSMLQACSLGIATVNIDSGIAGGVIAGLIAKRASK
ncbi:MAG: nickel pincer cofactor biosynthesis protein LarB [Thaumarchaeota archaeon]|nr:nickel pincer cofactor biosynthesis protein LarB [Nitrososphaerota archaeon]